MPKLIIVMAFDADPEDGELRPVFEPRECQSTHQAINSAKILATQHAGAIAWQREAHPETGDYGPPETLFRAGEVPDLD